MENDKKITVRVRGVILDNDKLLVVKHANNSNNSYALPGGHLEWKEDIRKCLEREVFEELGVLPDVGRLLYINNFMDSNNTQSVEFFFEIKNPKDYTNIENIKGTHAFELSSICWIDSLEKTPLLPLGVWNDFKKGEIISNEVKFL